MLAVGVHGLRRCRGTAVGAVLLVLLVLRKTGLLLREARLLLWWGRLPRAVVERALRGDESLELAAIQEDAAALVALVDRDAVAFVLAHHSMTLRQLSSILRR